MVLFIDWQRFKKRIKRVKSFLFYVFFYPFYPDVFLISLMMKKPPLILDDFVDISATSII